jgi:hypothetical protein
LAQQRLESAPTHCPLYTSPRFSREYLVYRLRVAQHQNDAAGSFEDVECLLEWHNRAKHLGRHDDSMEVLWTALWRAGKRIEASTLLRDYLFRARRERRPFGVMLRQRMAEDPIWRELALRDGSLGDTRKGPTPLPAIPAR